MKLMELVQQIQSSAGDKEGTDHTAGTVLQYLNEEIEFVCKRFPIKGKTTITTTVAGNYHDITFDVAPNIQIIDLLVNNQPGEKVVWNDLRGRI